MPRDESSPEIFYSFRSQTGKGEGIEGYNNNDEFKAVEKLLDQVKSPNESTKCKSPSAKLRKGYRKFLKLLRGSTLPYENTPLTHEEKTAIKGFMKDTKLTGEAMYARFKPLYLKRKNLWERAVISRNQYWKDKNLEGE